MQIEWNGFRLFYDRTGNGPEILLLFHGFGQDRSVFAPLIHQISTRYICYSFDLFFHGEDSDGRYSSPISPAQWNSFLSSFLERENIQRFSLAGFSIGARLVLSAIPHFGPRLDQLYLIAPEGISTNIWYRLATSTALGRYTFRRLVDRPKYFFAAASSAERLGILPRKVGRFAKKLMDSDQKRQRVWSTWMILSKLQTSRQQFIGTLNQYPVRVIIFLGKRDRIIPIRPVLNFVGRLKQKPEVHMIDSAHVTMIRTISQSCSQLFKYEGGSRR
jgi:pimeloyl-ACP methyl ester carboxylesterase